MSNIYESGEYLKSTKGSWHAEDSPWKAQQIYRIINNNGIRPKEIAEIGCGSGQVLVELSKHESLNDCQFVGYDISPQAIELCKKTGNKNCSFFCQDLLAEKNEAVNGADVLLVIDVFEHVPDYMGFIEQCKNKATYKIYHIPLDLHVSALLRNSFVRNRYSIGHLHYFSADSALATLVDTGHEIVDSFYTNGSLALLKHHPSIKTAIANGPRWFFSKFSLPITARVFGGYSLLVLAK
jgi:SAM-dependent methyltransferase